MVKYFAAGHYQLPEMQHLLCVLAWQLLTNVNQEFFRRIVRRLPVHDRIKENFHGAVKLAQTNFSGNTPFGLFCG